MFAIIEIGGKQYKVEKGTQFEIEMLDEEPQKTLEIKEILLIENNGENKIGTPYIEDASVSLKILDQVKGEKIKVFKKKPKKRYEKTIGHRQKKTLVEVVSIK